MKEEFNKDKETLKSKNQTETLEIKSSLSQIINKVESHSTDWKWKSDSQGSKIK
jgi:hypothetical protein